MNGVIDTTAPYVNIFICYGQQLKYLFASLYPFPQEILNTQTSELLDFKSLLKSPMGFVLKLVVEIASWLRKAK